MNSSTHSHRRPKPPDVQILTPEQIDQILAAANGDSGWSVVHDLVLIIYGTGIRRGELSDLLIADIDTARNGMRIVSTRDTYGGRFIPLEPNVLAAILRLHSLNPRSKFVLGDKAATRLMRASRDLSTIATQIGAGNASLHSLRAAFAARQSSGRMDPETLRRLMFHSSPQATYRYYRREPNDDNS